MQRFARLFAALDGTTKINPKVAALAGYFPRGARRRPPLDRGAAVRPAPQAHHGRHPPARMGRRGRRHPALAVRGILPHRRRPRRDHRLGPARTDARLGREPGDLDRPHPRDAEDGRSRPPRGGAGCLGQPRGHRAVPLQQARHRQLPRRRLGQAHDPRPGPGHRRARGRAGPPPDGRLDAPEHDLARADRRARPGRRPRPALPVLPRLSTRRPSGISWRARRLGGRAQVGRDPGPARDPGRRALRLVARRGADHRPLPRVLGPARLRAGRHRDRRRGAGRAGWRPPALRPATAPHRAQDRAQGAAGRGAPRSCAPTTCWNGAARTCAPSPTPSGARGSRRWRRGCPRTPRSTSRRTSPSRPGTRWPPPARAQPRRHGRGA